MSQKTDEETVTVSKADLEYHLELLEKFFTHVSKFREEHNDGDRFVIGRSSYPYGRRDYPTVDLEITINDYSNRDLTALKDSAADLCSARARPFNGTIRIVAETPALPAHKRELEGELWLVNFHSQEPR